MVGSGESTVRMVRGTRLKLCKGTEVELFASLLEAFNVL